MMPDTISGPRHATGDPTGVAPGEPPRFAWSRPSSWPQRIVAPMVYWVSTRLIMIMSVFQTGESANGEVRRLYQGWAQLLRHGQYPVGAPTWQYPPGAAGVILAPLAVPGVGYVQGFIAVTFVADLAVMAMLLWHGTRPGRSLGGAWIWLLVLPLMTYVPYARYDVIVTLFAVASLLLLKRRPGLGGAMASLGAMIKVWPAFAVFGMRWGRSMRSAAIGFVVSAGALLLIASTFFNGAFDFMNGQNNRGLEFESVPGSLLLMAHQFGYRSTIAYRYGSLEVVGPHVESISRAMLVLSVIGFCWLLFWRLRARTFSDSTPADAALAVVLVFITTSRVISPQYLIWVAGITAVCLSYRSTSQRPIAGLMMLATAMTTVEFPFFWQEVIAGRPGWDALLVARNLILLVATAWSCARLWRSTVPGRRNRREAAE